MLLTLTDWHSPPPLRLTTSLPRLSSSPAPQDLKLIDLVFRVPQAAQHAAHPWSRRWPTLSRPRPRTLWKSRPHRRPYPPPNSSATARFGTRLLPRKCGCARRRLPRSDRARIRHYTLWPWYARQYRATHAGMAAGSQALQARRTPSTRRHLRRPTLRGPPRHRRRGPCRCARRCHRELERFVFVSSFHQ